MRAAALVAKVRACGVELRTDGRCLGWRGPRGALTADLRKALADHRDDLLDLLLRVRELPLGRIQCAGCGETMPAHPSGLCFPCDLGLDRADAPTHLMPAAPWPSRRVRPGRGTRGTNGGDP